MMIDVWITVLLMVAAGLLCSLLVYLLSELHHTRALQEARERLPEWAQALTPMASNYMPMARRIGVTGIDAIHDALEAKVLGTTSPLDDMAAQPLLKQLEELKARLEKIESRVEAGQLAQDIDRAAFDTENPL